MAEARNPVGYEKDKLYQAINTASQRVAAHADMMAIASGNPMLFVVDVDEESGLQDAIYYWSGIEANLIAKSEDLVRKIDNYQVDTKAIADVFAATLTHSAFIEVLADETQGGIRALYFWNTISLQEPLLL